MSRVHRIASCIALGLLLGATTALARGNPLASRQQIPRLAVTVLLPDGHVRRAPVRLRPLRPAETRQFIADASGDDRVLAQWRQDRSLYYRWTADDQPLIDDLARQMAMAENGMRTPGRGHRGQAPTRDLPMAAVASTAGGSERILGVLIDPPQGPGLVHVDAWLRGLDYYGRRHAGKRVKGIGSCLYACRLRRALQRHRAIEVEAVNQGSRAFHRSLGFNDLGGRQMRLELEQIPAALQRIESRYGWPLGD